MIPDELDSAAAVDRLAEEHLTRSWDVMEELDVLPGTLEPGEQPQAMAHAGLGGKSGPVVLTDRRLLFVSRKPTDEEFVELPRAKLGGAEAGSNLLGATRLRVDHDGTRVDFKAIETKERAGEIAALLGDGA